MSLNTEIKIGLAGNGWGFDAALKSLLHKFSCIEIYNPIDKDDLLKRSYSSKLKFIDQLGSFEADYIVCAGLKDIIPKAYLERKKFINIHYSLLPSYRGLHSTVWAILNDEAYLGYTVHLMNEFIDDGPIIYQHKTKNSKRLNSAEYMRKFNLHVEQNLHLALFDFLNGKTEAIKQNKQNASWVAKRTISDCLIDFHKETKYLENFFRALVQPYPIPYFKLNDQKYYPRLSKFQHSDVKSHIGRIVNLDEEGLWVTISDGYIVFDQVKDDNGNVISLTNFKIGQWVK